MHQLQPAGPVEAALVADRAARDNTCSRSPAPRARAAAPAPAVRPAAGSRASRAVAAPCRTPPPGRSLAGPLQQRLAVVGQAHADPVDALDVEQALGGLAPGAGHAAHHDHAQAVAADRLFHAHVLEAHAPPRLRRIIVEEDDAWRDGARGKEGRVAVVTGGARGIGWATVQALVADGVRPVLFDRDEAALADAGRRLAERGVDHHAANVDVADEAAVERAMAAVVSRFGRLDILVNNAGIALRRPTLELGARRLAEGGRRQPDRRLPLRPGRGAGDGRRRRRGDRQRRLDHGPLRRRPLSEPLVPVDQGRGRQPDPGPRGRVGDAGASASTRWRRPGCGPS